MLSGIFDFLDEDSTINNFVFEICTDRNEWETWKTLCDSKMKLLRRDLQIHVEDFLIDIMEH